MKKQLLNAKQLTDFFLKFIQSPKRIKMNRKEIIEQIKYYDKTYHQEGST
ncbi:MAG: hypothetical protein ACRCXT_03895 [Paraclostridium sp.]